MQGDPVTWNGSMLARTSVAVLLVIVIVGTPVAYSVVISDGDLDRAAALGNALGPLSVVYSGLALVALLMTLWHQIANTQRQHKEFLDEMLAARKSQRISALEAELVALSALLTTELEIARMQYPNRELKLDSLPNRTELLRLRKRIDVIVEELGADHAAQGAII